MSKECCQSTHKFTSPSVCQTLDELAFERGIWNSAMEGDIEKLKSQLGKGVDPSVCDNYGYTALHYAARNGKEAVCELLLKSGANVNAQNCGGSTPLHRAAYLGNINIVSLLVKYGADASIADSDGKTALHKATEGKHFEIAKILVSASPDSKLLKDKKNNTPLSYTDANNTELFNLLS